MIGVDAEKSRSLADWDLADGDPSSSDDGLEICLAPMQVQSVLEVHGRASLFDPATKKG